MPDSTKRQVSLEYGREGDVVSFADGYPYLLTNEATLDDLCTRLSSPLGMDRFRPNLVLTGAPAFAEDDMKRLRIGDAVFDVVKPCTRCSIVTTDQTTGARPSLEPLATLARYRTWNGQPFFGQNLILRTGRHLALGAAVQSLSEADV